MMKQELESLLTEMNGSNNAVTVPDTYYATIETVYLYHPAIKDKQAMAQLYWNFGMRIIVDMLPTSNTIKAIEDEVQKHRSQIARLTEQRQAIERMEEIEG